MTAAVRFPLAPLQRLASVWRGELVTSHELAVVARVRPDVVRAAVAAGGLTVGLADRLAIGWGWHPALVWGDDWLTDGEDRCDEGHLWAGNEYWRPDRPGKRQCRACNREAQRRYARKAAL